MRNSLAIVLLMIAMIACKPTVPSEYIQPAELEDILYDYHVAQAMATESYRNGSESSYNKHAYFMAVLKKYHVTEAEFDSSLVFYYSHADRLKSIYEKVQERLNDEAKALGASVGDLGRYSQYNTTGDTANVWQNETDMLLMPIPTANRYDIYIKADTSYYNGDSFLFQFMSDFVYQSGSRDAAVCLVAKYEGDSLTQTINHITVSGLSQVRIPHNREGKLKELRGFIYLTNSDRDNDSKKMLFISQIQLIRFHQKQKQDEQKAIREEKEDSVPRTSDPKGGNTDTVRRGDIPKQGERLLPSHQRTTLHRVDQQPLKIEERQ